MARDSPNKPQLSGRMQLDGGEEIDERPALRTQAVDADARFLPAMSSGRTTTDTGLKVQATHDPSWYPTGVKISNVELAAVPLVPHDWHGE